MESYQIKNLQSPLGSLEIRHPLPLPAIVQDGPDELNFLNIQNKPQSLVIDFESNPVITDEFPHNAHNIQVLKRLQKSGRLHSLGIEIVSLKEIADAEEKNIEDRYSAVEVIRKLTQEDQVRWARHFNVSALETEGVLKVKLMKFAETSPEEVLAFAANKYREVYLDFDEAIENGVVSHDVVDNVFRFGGVILGNSFGEASNVFVTDSGLYESMKRQLKGGITRAVGIEGAEKVKIETANEEANLVSAEVALISALNYPEIAVKQGIGNRDVKVALPYGDMVMKYEVMQKFLEDNIPARKALLAKLDEIKAAEALKVEKNDA